MTKYRSKEGFTLIEILLVVVIIGIMLAVIVPRAWRANVDAKYGLVRQAASELGSFATEWAETQIVAQLEDDEATMFWYLVSLAGNDEPPSYEWVGLDDDSNWNNNEDVVEVWGRDNDPETSVEGIVPPEKQPRNPFNGASYFTRANDASETVIPGALACAYNAEEEGYAYFAFLFLGTDSEDPEDFHAGQSTDLEGLRNGVFIARVGGLPEI